MSRQGGDMPRPVDPAAHDTHDALLVAAFAAGDAAGADLAAATALVTACPDCAALHRDLRAIATALPELPAPARPRDFRLTAEQATALRPAGWRGILATLAGPRFSFAVPLGSGLAALGIAGILLGSLAGVPLGAGGAAGAPSGSGDNLVEAPLPATASSVPSGAAGPEAGPVASEDGALPEDATPPGDNGAVASGTDLQAEAWTKQAEESRLTDAVVVPAAGLSAGVLAALAGGLALFAGVGLVVARWVARRLA